ncbi:MAG: ribose-5-phosphate isomerase RpiA [Acidobacteria bacterium]|nr:ribose-5-phosphate isomerase RpiA [Acidobacteriota bacterium]
MSVDDQKRAVAEAALEFVRPGEVLGVGTGSTANHFIDLLGERFAGRVPACVSSSEASTDRLRELGFKVIELAEVDSYSIYVDGADEFEPGLAMIKGGGAALTSEKIVSSLAEQFICIVDASKRVDVMGAFPLPVEIIGMAARAVSRALTDLGGEPVLREGVVTDHGNPIIDVHGMRITDPVVLEGEIEAIPGVVTCGLFARRPADVVLMGTDQGVQRFGG